MIRGLVQLIDTGIMMSFEREKPWHSSEELQNSLLAFHETYASYPKQAIAEAKRHHEETMTTIRDDLRGDGVVQKLEYTGSTYELIKVPSTEMEFDVMVVLAGGKDITANETKRSPLYAQLSTASRTGPLSKIVDPHSDLLMPEKAASYFTSKLQQTLNNHPELGEIKLVRHGPAIQMDIYKMNGWGSRELFYSVDMVPSFFIPSRSSGGTYYVAKGFKEVDDGKTDTELALEAQYVQTSWRKSFSLKEKDEIKKIDDGNQCRKQCMRMFKVLRDKEEGLKRINSYIIKTAVLSLDRDYKVLSLDGDYIKLDWNQKRLGQRFINVLQYLEQALDRNNLSHFYVPEFNLLADFSPIHRQNMRDRLRELIRSEQIFLKALSPRQSSSMNGRPQAWRQELKYETESDSDDEPEGACSYSAASPVCMKKKEEGEAVLPILIGGVAIAAAAAAALWAGASWFGGDKDKKDKDKK